MSIWAYGETVNEIQRIVGDRVDAEMARVARERGKAFEERLSCYSQPGAMFEVYLYEGQPLLYVGPLTVTHYPDGTSTLGRTMTSEPPVNAPQWMSEIPWSPCGTEPRLRLRFPASSAPQGL